MMRGRGVLLGGACFAMLAGAGGGAVAPSSMTAAPLATPAAAASSMGTKSPTLVANRRTTTSATKFDPSRKWQLVHLTRSNAPLDVTPVVNSVTPSSGSTAGGTAIVIIGTGFTNTTSVTIAGTVVTANPCPLPGGCFTFVNDTEIDATTPPGSAGTSDVIITNPTFASAPNPPSDNYTSQQPLPAITSVTPDSGPEIGGSPAITIHGSDFSGSGFTTTGVSIGGNAAVFSPTATTITATPPPGTGLVDIIVTTSSTDGTSVQTSQTSSADTYVYAPVPTVSGVAPNVGPTTGQNTVTLTGTGFESTNPLADANFSTTHVFVDVTNINTSPCPGTPTGPCFTASSPTSISVQDMPVHVAAPVDITVQTPGGTSATSSNDQYTYEPLPTVTSVVPSSGVLAGGGIVTVNGTGFTSASVATVGGQSVSPCPGSPCFNNVSATQITIDAFPSSGSPATVDITVTTPFGTSATSSADSYTYMPVPTVTVVSPNAGSPAGGNTVTLTGTGFEFGTFAATIVSVAGVGNPSFTVNSATSITIAAIPAGPSLGGMFHVTVTTAGGTSTETSADIYTYVASFPAVTTVSPKFGATGGGAYVTIIGANFGAPNQGFGATDVLFGSKDVSASSAFPCPGSAAGCFVQIGTTTLDVYTPSVAAGSAGTVDITVQTPGGNSNVGPSDKYTYVAPGAYTALSPFRICDTRKAGPGIAANQCDTGPGRGTLGPGWAITAQITGGAVPSNAQAVVVNLTAINHGFGPTYVSAYPAGAQTLTSNINLAGRTVEANLAIVRLSAAGQISVFNAAGTADVIVDVEGYFAAAGGGSAGAFHSIPPLRICDSRGGVGNTTICATATGRSSAPLVGGVWRHVTLSGLPPGAPPTTPYIPTNGTAAAAVFNLTATAGSLPTYLSVAVPTGSDACPSSAPSFSNLNPTPGISLPNRVISNLGPNQDICLYSALGSINFIIDVNGWFGTGSAPAGAFFYSVPPTRICDTRPSFGTRCQNRALGTNPTGELIQVAGIVAVPASLPHALADLPVATAVVANLTAVAGTAATYFTLYPSDASKPTASDLNPSAGEVIANLAITGLGQTGATTVGNVNLYNPVGTINALLDVAGWFQ